MGVDRKGGGKGQFLELHLHPLISLNSSEIGDEDSDILRIAPLHI
jgi:hypothetical protein